MQVTTNNVSKNKVILTISADKVEMDKMKTHILDAHFKKDLKIPGFRPGKVPLSLVEKNIDQNQFQGQFLDEIINDLYSKTIVENRLKVVDQPKVEIKKFVPFDQLEFTAEVEIIEKIKLPDYKNIKVEITKPRKVNASEVDEVIEKIRVQLSEKKDVNRASKLTDQVWIDFEGFDDQKKPVNGADGKDYPLLLGSDTFIPGFETNAIGLKANDGKTFVLKFPKDYHVKALASRDVTFKVHVIKVQEVVKPEVNDDLAIKSGPFKTIAELKADISNQLQSDIDFQDEKDYESKLVTVITDKTKFDIPEPLVMQEVNSRLDELKQNLLYRGQTFDEYLSQEAKTETQLIESDLKPESIKRLKTGILLSEIAEAEGITVSKDEVDGRIHQLMQQYKDETSQTEMSKPEFRQQTASRLLTEKTVKKLVSYSLKK